jgi:hypothetical protein
VAKLADDVGGSSPQAASDADVRRELADLAERMRSTVTPVIGYLELISQDWTAVPPERYLNWIATIERRLDAMRETCDQISAICDVLRDSVGDREGSTPRAPEARED